MQIFNEEKQKLTDKDLVQALELNHQKRLDDKIKQVFEIYRKEFQGEIEENVESTHSEDDELVK